MYSISVFSWVGSEVYTILPPPILFLNQSGPVKGVCACWAIMPLPIGLGGGGGGSYPNLGILFIFVINPALLF